MASDWLCQVGFEEDGISFVSIVHRDFWETNGYVDDTCITEAIKADVPTFSLMDVGDSVYEYEGTAAETKAHLESLGMTVTDLYPNDP